MSGFATPSSLMPDKFIDTSNINKISDNKQDDNAIIPKIVTKPVIDEIVEKFNHLIYV